jgi:nucleotide-binding universal stress UspA family protein
VLPIRKILCPTDFSDPSYRSLSVACELAEHFSAAICVLHVVAPIPTVAANVGPSAFNINTYQFELENDAKEMLQKVIGEKVPESVTASAIVSHGNAAEKILDAAAENDGTDLIVIATRGRTGWRNTLFGSVAERVVRLSPIPVLTVSGKPTA